MMHGRYLETAPGQMSETGASQKTARAGYEHMTSGQRHSKIRNNCAREDLTAKASMKKYA
jgi:hypothetical protein